MVMQGADEEDDDGPIFPALHAACTHLREKLLELEQGLALMGQGAGVIGAEEDEEEGGGGKGTSVGGGLRRPSHQQLYMMQQHVQQYAAYSLLLSALEERQGQAAPALLALGRLDRALLLTAAASDTTAAGMGEGGLAPYVRNRPRIRRLLRLAFRQVGLAC